MALLCVEEVGFPQHPTINIMRPENPYTLLLGLCQLPLLVLGLLLQAAQLSPLRC